MTSVVKILIFLGVFLAGIGTGMLIGSAYPPAATGEVTTTLTPTEATASSVPPTATHAVATPTPSSTATVVPTAGTATASSSSGGVSPSVVTTVSPTPAPTPDPIVGTWKGSKTVLFVYSGEATVTFNADHTASVSGFVQGPGLDKTIATGFTWENLGSSKYRGTYSSKSLDFVMSGNTLIMTINPAKLEISDKLNMDITLELSRL